jgi:hypothetical protein
MLQTTTYTATHRFAGCTLLIACLLGVELIITKTTTFIQHPLPISIGILFDCTILATALFYGLVARPLQLPISRTVLFAIAMLRLALFITPSATPLMERIWPVLLVLAEGTVVIISVLRFRKITRTYRALRPTHDVPAAFHGALAAVFGEKTASIIASEGQVIYQALFNWHGPVEVPVGTIAVTTHRESGQLVLLIGLLSVGLIEATAMHFLLAVWWPVVAFWVTAASLYGCLMILAIINTTRKRPSFLTETMLHLRLDMRWQAVISLDNITTVTPIFDKPTKQPRLLNTTLVTAPNVLITLHDPVVIGGIYGLSRTVTQLSLFIDDRSAFINSIQLQRS